MENTIKKSKNLSITNNIDEKYVTSKKAMQKLGVSIVTLRTWASNGLIETIRTGGNHRLYNVDKYLKDCMKKNIIQKDIDEIDNNKSIYNSHKELKKKLKKKYNNKDGDTDNNDTNNNDTDTDTDNNDTETSIIKYKNQTTTNKKENICYIRVSSTNEIDYLNKQKIYMDKYYPNHRIIEDIGSSIDLNRKGLQEIINLLLNNKLESIVIMNKNILCSIGYDLINTLFYKYNSKIIIETNKYKNTNDIMYDMQAIIHYYQKNGGDLERGCVEDNNNDNKSRVKIDLISDVTEGVNLGLKSNKSSVINDLSGFKSGVI